ncbi:MAG: periplasmic heavy metal sensor [Pseudomonadota bacterium]
MTEHTTSRLPIWLIVSLVVNALLVGLLIGGGLGQRKAGPSPGLPGSEQALIRGIDRSVPDDQRRAVRRAFRRAFADTRPERIRIRESRRKLAQLLAADTYDAEAVRQGFEAFRAADAAMKARMHDILAEQFGKLTVEQRQAILRDYNRRNRRPGSQDGDRPPPPRRD